MLVLRDVRKHFADPSGGVIAAVDGVTLEVGGGQVAAIYGPSGSGKTTLLLLMAGIAQPDSGAIRFDGQDLATLSRRGLAHYRLHEVGFVFQSCRLMPGMSAVDNAAVKLMRDMSAREARRRVAPLLERVGLQARALQPAAQLSMGERQRVLIARALSNDPRLVLADEPTGSLDTRRGAEILQLLAELSRERGAGVVLVTHDPQAADVADSVRVLRDGLLLEHPSRPTPEPAGAWR